MENIEELPFGVEDDEVTTAIHAAGFGDAKMRALAEHATQVTVDGDFFALSNQFGREIESTEHFRLVRGDLGAERDADGCGTRPVRWPGRMTLERPVSGAEASEAPREGADSPALAIAGLVLCGLTAVLAGLVEVLLSPLYVGRWLFPITLLLAVGTNVALPVTARDLVDSTVAATLPVILWLITVLVLSLPRPEGDVLLPGGGALQWVSYGLVLIGGAAGAITIALTARRSRSRPPAQSQVATPTRR